MTNSLVKKNLEKALLSQSKILIVEDDRVERIMLKQIFDDYGFKNVYEAGDGLEGWSKTLEVDPDLILLDMKMPIMDGFEFIKKARSHPEYKDTTILVQTGLVDKKEMASIFEAGATDYVTKPIDFYEISARSIIHLEKSLQDRKMRSFYKRIQDELQSAKQLIEISLPDKQSIEQLRETYKIDLAAEFKSSNEMGGDFWGFYPLNKTSLVVYCIDLSGHGIDSALNALRLHSILHTSANDFSKPGEILGWINNKICGLFPVGKFATMFCGIIDVKNDELSYATAATTEAIILHDNNLPAKILSGKGYPIGIFKDAEFETHTASFEPGDSLLLYSDAIIEENDKNGKIFGIDNFIKMLKVFEKEDCFSSKKVLDDLLKSFYEKCGVKNLKDDLTINVYHRMK